MKIGIFFSGYDNQIFTTSKELYDSHRIIQEYIEEASYCLETDINKLSFASSAAQVQDLVNAYPLLFTWQSAVMGLLKNDGVEPTLIGGMGIGFLSALQAAQGLSLPDGLYIAQKIAQRYAQHLEEQNFVLMYIRGVVDARRAEAHGVDVVLIDAVGYGVMGIRSVVEKFVEEFSDNNSYEMPLSLLWNGPFGEDLSAQLQLYSEKFDVVDTSYPVIAATDGSLLSTGPVLKQELFNQCNIPVSFTPIIEHLGGCDMVIVPFVDDYVEKKLQQAIAGKVMSVSTQRDYEQIITYIQNRHEDKEEKNGI